MQPAPIQNIAYNYSALPHDVADVAQRASARIRSMHRQSIIESGLLLIEVKAALGHGHFTSWCEAELGFSPTTARNYMRAAERFGGKSAIVAVLPPGALYVAAAAHDDVRADIIRRIEAGETLGRTDVDHLVSVHREGKRYQKKAEARRLKRQGLTDEERLQYDRRVAREERQWQQRADAQQQAALDLVTKLNERFSMTEIKEIADLFDKTGLTFAGVLNEHEKKGATA